MLDGYTKLIPHIGDPTGSFKAPMIYNPYFESIGVNAAVVPFGVTAERFQQAYAVITTMTNFHGALITMPHKVTTVALLDEASTTVKIAGSCNALVRRPDGRIAGDMFDGEGFVRGVARKGVAIRGARVLVVGCGGVGSAIAASFAGTGVAQIALFDMNAATADSLAERIRTYHPQTQVTTGTRDPAGFDIVVNGTPLGMKPGDPLPFDVERLSPTTFVGEVVMTTEITPMLMAAKARGCRIQPGIDMLFEMIPPYLEFFGLPTTTPEALRAVAKIHY
jgi:shikimate dehydrogenase